MSTKVKVVRCIFLQAGVVVALVGQCEYLQAGEGHEGGSVSLGSCIGVDGGSTPIIGAKSTRITTVGSGSSEGGTVKVCSGYSELGSWGLVVGVGVRVRDRQALLEHRIWDII
jgi:hypothetical protein